MKSPHLQTGVVLGPQKHKHHEESDMARIEHEETSLGHHFEVERQQKAAKAHPKAYFLYPVRFQRFGLTFCICQLVSPKPNQVYG
jgi:hypothetical protein